MSYATLRPTLAVCASSSKNGSCRLEIHDDGCGGFNGEGNGLRGMRERVEMLGGTLNCDTEAGTRLTITLPLREVTPKPEACVKLIFIGAQSRPTK